jgi:hypothetical protein
MIAAPCLLATLRHTSVDARQVRGIGYRIFGPPNKRRFLLGGGGRPDRSTSGNRAELYKENFNGEGAAVPYLKQSPHDNADWPPLS